MAPCRGFLRFLRGSDLDGDKEWSEIVKKLTSQDLKLNGYDENGLVNTSIMRLREPKQLSFNAWSVGADIKNPDGSTEKANVTLIRRRLNYDGPIWIDSPRRRPNFGFELHGDSDSARWRVDSQPMIDDHEDERGERGWADANIIHKDTNKSNYLSIGWR